MTWTDIMPVQGAFCTIVDALHCPWFCKSISIFMISVLLHDVLISLYFISSLNQTSTSRPQPWTSHVVHMTIFKSPRYAMFHPFHNWLSALIARARLSSVHLIFWGLNIDEYPKIRFGILKGKACLKHGFWTGYPHVICALAIPLSFLNLE